MHYFLCNIACFVQLNFNDFIEIDIEIKKLSRYTDKILITWVLWLTFPD